MTETFIPTKRTQVRRLPARGNYEQSTVYSILDAGLICHVGFNVDGHPRVIPTAYGRIADQLFLHGSPASRMLNSLKTGIEVCVTVTLLDGLVLARSAMHHSMNYRSVVIFGTATVVGAPEGKLEALRAFTEHVIPGRWAQVRTPNPQELAATLVLALPLVEVSAKVRTGPPKDDEADLSWPVWAGEIPLSLQASAPVADPLFAGGVEMPEEVARYTRR